MHMGGKAQKTNVTLYSIVLRANHDCMQSKLFLRSFFHVKNSFDTPCKNQQEIWADLWDMA